MIQLLEFTFQDLWHFLGIAFFTVLILTASVAIVEAIASIFKRK